MTEYYYRILSIDNKLNAVTRFWSSDISEDDLAIERNPDGSIKRNPDGTPTVCFGDGNIALYDPELVNDQQKLHDYIGQFIPMHILDFQARLKAGVDTGPIDAMVGQTKSRVVTNPRYADAEHKFIIFTIDGKDVFAGASSPQAKSLLSQAGVAIEDVQFTPSAQQARDASYVADTTRSEWIERLKNASLADIETFVRGKINADAAVDLATARACLKRIETAFVIMMKVLAPRINQ